MDALAPLAKRTCSNSHNNELSVRYIDRKFKEAILGVRSEDVHRTQTLGDGGGPSTNLSLGASYPYGNLLNRTHSVPLATAL